jgi:hypothetical protein
MFMFVMKMASFLVPQFLLGAAGSAVDEVERVLAFLERCGPSGGSADGQVMWAQ